MKTWHLGYKKSKEKAKDIYSNIGQIPCPALDDDIYFNSRGFNHIIRKGRIPRPHNEQKRRFCLLPYAEEILRNPQATIEFRQQESKIKINRYGEDILTTRMVSFWTFSEIKKDCKIKIVIAQFGVDSQKIFLSIMGDNVQLTKSKQKNR